MARTTNIMEQSSEDLFTTREMYVIGTVVFTIFGILGVLVFMQ